jgi:hypothetical protein
MCIPACSKPSMCHRVLRELQEPSWRTIDGEVVRVFSANDVVPGQTYAADVQPPQKDDAGAQRLHSCLKAHMEIACVVSVDAQNQSHALKSCETVCCRAVHHGSNHV